MSVIVERALPDMRRPEACPPRMLSAMYDGGYRPDRGYSKCARVIGDVMGTTIPTATPPSTTPWSASPSPGRCDTLVDGHGNFGSPGNDPAPPCATPSAGSPRSPSNAARHRPGHR